MGHSADGVGLPGLLQQPVHGGPGFTRSGFEKSTRPRVASIVLSSPNLIKE